MPLPQASNTIDATGEMTAGRRRAVRRGLLAVAIAWLAWFYWFSRAALLAIATVAIGAMLFLLARTAFRLLKAGGGVYRHLCLRMLLSLARRVV